MKLKDKEIVNVQVYPGRQFGTVIGSNNGLIGILLNSGEYIDVHQERLRVIFEGVEREGEKDLLAQEWDEITKEVAERLRGGYRKYEPVKN